ncbi:hypothetical protein [Alicyclobacillus fodiniaquatilis]|jgi:hypothetical protein|uniref:Uncharacterized protein n=1 Tax=Alicyclobacillus fodiniaquatilis TaxID=1661150 RepID=A0ABW4JM89_9BACL
MEQFDTNAMKFVYQARLDQAANNRRGYAVENPSSSLFYKMWKSLAERK